MVNSEDNTVSLLLGNDDGSFHTPTNYPDGLSPYSVISADFNNDKKLDIAVVNIDDATVGLLLGDNDKKMELVVTNSASDYLYVLLNICN